MEELRGVKLLHAAVKQILDHPETWSQADWHCGSKHCVAGWCQILGGDTDHTDTALRAKEMLGVSSNDASWLFSPDRSVSDIVSFTNHMIRNPEGYDRAGYDRAGYDRDGYSRDGYDRAGYSRDGYSRYGYSRAGYDRDGYDSDGYDRYGYDRAGYSRYGYSRYGYDRDGYDRAGYSRDGYDRA